MTSPSPAPDGGDYWDQFEDFDDERQFEDEEDDGENCGRWINGTLSRWCTKAGSEECDWHCPIGLPSRRPKKRPAPLLDLMKDEP